MDVSAPNEIKVVIIGNGIAGITAARHIRKMSDYHITVISSESKHFFSRTALMYVYMGHMRKTDIEPYEQWFWEKNRIELMQEHVVSIDFNFKKIKSASGALIHYDKLIIACGSASIMPGIPGIESDGVRGLYSIQDLEYIDAYSKNVRRAVIAGGGLIGIELAEMFHSRKIPVTYLVRESAFWNEVLPKDEAEMINRHLISHGIDLQLDCEIHAIKTDTAGRVNGVITNNGMEFHCDFVGMAMGVHPNINWLRNSGLVINRGILVDDYLKTNIEDVFAIGDCAELKNPLQGRKPVEAIWYAGRMMGESVAYTLCGRGTKYDPGIWFNSAKFFDIEYQVYGNISPASAGTPGSFFWKHDDDKKCIRINYSENGPVIGFNALGIRLRQEVCESWIKNKTPIDAVMSEIALMMFDPELGEDYSHAIRLQFQHVTGRMIEGKRKGNYNPVHRFLTRQKLANP